MKIFIGFSAWEGKKNKPAPRQAAVQNTLLLQNKVSNSEILVYPLTDAVSDHHHIYLGDLCHRVPTVCKFASDSPLWSVPV